MEEFLKKQAEMESGGHLALLGCMRLQQSSQCCDCHREPIVLSFTMWCDDALGLSPLHTLLSTIEQAAAGSLLAQPAEPVIEVVGAEAVTEQVSSACLDAACLSFI